MKRQFRATSDQKVTSFSKVKSYIYTRTFLRVEKKQQKLRLRMFLSQHNEASPGTLNENQRVHLQDNLQHSTSKRPVAWEI